ncbi:MAG: UDP-3-O-acyl-N-acetylglucosamine deacetylase [bacterium]
MFDQVSIPPNIVMQTTLRQAVTLEGIGLHSGEMVTLTLSPATAGTGIVFQRHDLLACDRAEVQSNSLELVSIKACPTAVRSTQLGTTIANEKGISVSTVEHLMAAFAGFGIDNAIIQINGPEVPIMDGSAEPFMALIERSGIRHLSTPRKAIRLKEEITVKDSDRWITILPAKSEGETGCSIDVLVDYDDPIIGKQRASFAVQPTAFRQEVAAARTFCYLQDVETMRARGLALGGSYDNAIVVNDGAVMNEEGLRFKNEFAYHKALDLVGDLYLLAHPIVGQVMAFKPGHDLNTRLAKTVLETPQSWEFTEISLESNESLLALA